MQTCVMVLGMHRSGTSALGGVLEQLGIRMGRVLIQPTADNPKGYFENQRIADFNDNRIFPLFKSSWYDIGALPKAWYDQPELEALYDEAKAIIKEDYAGVEIFGIKDPRICVLFPFWERVLKELGIDIKVILPYRSPLEVHQSMHKRNGFSIEKSLVLWSQHMLYAEFYSRNQPRIFTTYEALLKSPMELLGKVAEHLQITYPHPLESIADELNAFLDEGLRHTTDSGSLTFEVPAFVQDTNTLFLEVVKGTDPDSLAEAFDKARAEYVCIARFMLNEDLEREIDKKIQSALKAQRLGRKIEKAIKRLIR